MRPCLFAQLCLVLCLPPAIAQEEPKPITAAEAVKKVGEEVTVQMEVKAAALRQGLCFLNSETDRRDMTNLTIFMDRAAVLKFKDVQIDDPAAHFKGKTIQVKGKVTLFRERPQIAVSNPDAIKIVEKK